MKKLRNAISRFGPAIIAIGFTIGTGSVTSMIVAGSRFGADLLWVIFLSCLFSWACIEAYGRFYLATGHTALYGMKKYLPFGKYIAWLIIIGVTLGQYNSLMGNLTITSNAIFEAFNLFIPGLRPYNYGLVVGLAAINVATMYFLLNTGKYKLFERILTVFVGFMALSFLLSMFIEPPSVKEAVAGFVPRIPEVDGAMRLVVAFVGTTMASATFLSRPLFLQAKGWTKADSRHHTKDSLRASVGIFILSASIMFIAMATLHKDGKTVEIVLDMVSTLEPIAGRFAIAIFLLGTLSAGLTSIFPMLMITPMMLSDYQHGRFEMGTRQFKVLTAVAALVGLVGPLYGGNPIQVQIFSQVLLVVALPLVIIAILYFVNNKKLILDLKAGIWLNTGLVLALIFSILITYYGVTDIVSAITKYMD
ncbi:MAG: Nramp family divalent metal transporter [Saprospiraceae bacterium]|nr:Nramp family divalent metal transporter [Saprospiraceae bacterium]MBK8776904.1 Nramp family divalent metal transporter [Saprospiraceae bacterium]